VTTAHIGDLDISFSTERYMPNQSVPVALFAYARPAHLRQTLDALRSNRVPLIYAFSDGARDPSVVERVEKVRQILREVNWCELMVLERESNLGLGQSIRQGVSAVLDQHETVIVVEDDIVFRPGAYDYASKALEVYQHSEDVMSISLWTDPTITPLQSLGGFFAERFVCWGWATYRKWWNLYLDTPLQVMKQCELAGIDFEEWGADLRWQAEHAAERNLWYVGYALLHLLHEKVSYFPPETLTVNIGFDGTGENSGIHADPSIALIDCSVDCPETWPTPYVQSETASGFLKYFEIRGHSVSKPSLTSRGSRKLRRLLQTLCPNIVGASRR